MKRTTTMCARQRKRHRKALFELQKGLCFWCGVPMVADPRKVYSLAAKKLAATLDHIIPRSKNGANARTNLVMACKECNERRSSMDAEEFLYVMRGEASPAPSGQAAGESQGEDRVRALGDADGDDTGQDLGGSHGAALGREHADLPQRLLPEPSPLQQGLAQADDAGAEGVSGC